MNSFEPDIADLLEEWDLGHLYTYFQGKII